MFEFYRLENREDKCSENKEEYHVFNEFEDCSPSDTTFYEDLPNMFDYTKGELSRMTKREILENYKKEYLLDLLHYYMLKGNKGENISILMERAEKILKRDLIEFTMHYRKGYEEEWVINSKRDLIEVLDKQGLRGVLSFSAVYFKNNDNVNTLMKRILNSVPIEDIEDFLADYDVKDS